MRKFHTLLGFLFLTSPFSVTASQQLNTSGDDIEASQEDDQNPCAQYSQNSSLINEYVQCLSNEASKGSISAANILTNIYVGSGALLPVYVKAVYYAAISAGKDDPNGMQVLSLLKASGLGTEKNWGAALQLRRRQAQLHGALGPLWISGEFTGYGKYEAGVATITVEVNPDGTKKSCSATGSTEKNHKFVCKVVMEVFGFLPAVSAEGQEVLGRYFTNITLKPYVKPPKIDTNIPARLVSGEITRQDFASANINLESSSLILNLDLSSTGAIVSCQSSSVISSFSRAACQIAKRKLTFAPSKTVRGKGVSSSYNFTVNLGSDNVEKEKPLQAPLPNIANKETDNSSEFDDKILQNAIKRCELIGFEKGTDDYKICVTDQIKLLSGIK